MWTFHLPTKIMFGAGSTASFAAMPELAECRTVVVTGPVIGKLPAIQGVIEQLSPVAIFDDVRPNPTVRNVDALATLLREEEATTVVAIGGGSVLDCAKAAAFLAVTIESSIRPYHSGGLPVDRAGLPLITIPTTAGTGSEVTPITVLDDEEKNLKAPLASPLLYPVIAVVDPEWTLSVPLGVTAATALDALSHSIEGYWSRHHQPICDALAKEAAKTIFTYLPEVYDNLANPIAREQLSYAALVAGIAFHMPRNAIMHACSYPLSCRAHLPHGAACAFTMEASIRLNAPHMEGRMEKFAAACGFASIDEMTAQITLLKKRGGLPCTLTEAGIAPELVETLIQESFHPMIQNNPKEVTVEDLRKIYAELG